MSSLASLQVGSLVSYLVAFFVPALDAIFPALLTGYPRRRFVSATAVAAVIWALYAFFIGRLGGKAFEDNEWAGLLIAFGASIAISAVIEAGRRLWARSRRQVPATESEDGQAAQPVANPAPVTKSRRTG
jgi:membrane protein DedA with SNARE-associated domain